MDICGGATVNNITESDSEGTLLETSMRDICSLGKLGFQKFAKDYQELTLNSIGTDVPSLMSNVTAFCFINCGYTCPPYIYEVANQTDVVKERLAAFMPPAHYGYSFIVPFVSLIGFILLVGVLGNLLTIVVIVKNRVLQASSHYLLSLAVSDILLLVLTGPTEIASDLHYWPWNYTRVLCRLRYYLIEACAFTTVLHIATFTIERYFVICHPMRAKSLVSASRTKKIISLIWIVSFISASPLLFAYDMLYACEGIPESTVCEIKNSIWEARVKKFYIFSSIILFFIPMFLITVLYSLIARVMFGYNVKVSMRRSASVVKGRKKKGAKKLETEGDCIEKSRRQVVKMLALIAVCFFACWFPFHMIRLMPNFGSDGWSDWFKEVFYYKWLYHASILFLYISSVVNPFLYNLMSTRFRRAMVATLCCQDNKHGSTGVYDTRATSVGATSV